MKRLALAALVLAVPAVSPADTVGTYAIKSDKGSRALTVSYKNEQAVRMDVGDDAYMLVSGDKVYMVSIRNGKTTAVDMSTLPKFGPTPKPESKPSEGRMTKTGRTETIAGVPGDVYEVITAEGRKHELVVSTDKRVQGIGKGFMALGKRMNQSSGGDPSIDTALRAALKQGGGAMLRTDQSMVLQSVAEKSLPASHYQLPAGVTPQQMPSFGGGPGGQGMPQMDPAAMKKMQEAMQKMMQQRQQQAQ
ncbi:MAG: hypothetical protein ACOY33_07805 [Pseudomonadota bacterium]